jgi:TonB family protein
MQSRSNAVPAEPVKAPLHGFRLLVEPEPRLRTFWDNLGELFRPDPGKGWLASPPGEYWPDALVHRPLAWTRMLQSYLGHLVVVTCIYGLNVWWLNQPHVIAEDPPRNTTILHYQVSEYLPEVKPQASQPEPPIRRRAQQAAPEYSPQKIVSLHVDHDSNRQTIIQPDPRLLRLDVPMPNLVAWTPAPVAAPVASRRSPSLLEMPVAPKVVAPPPPTMESDASRLVFPPAQPEVIAPSNLAAASRATTQLLALSVAGPVVIAPSQDMVARDPSRLQLAAQAPPQVTGPSSAAVAHSHLALIGPVGQPEVVSPTQTARQRNLASMQVSEPKPAIVPPSQPIAGGMGPAEARASGQLLALNARPLPPNGSVKIPEGNRRGEFAAGPEGHVGASATPETKEGNLSASDRLGTGGGRANVDVDTPPVKIASNAVVAGPKASPMVAAGPAAGADVPASDKIDNQVFGGRRRYSMRLTMPNLNSAMGSWTVRFAELNADPNSQSDLTAPEAIRKVDPAYPSNLVRDQIEGVVVLHAIIRSDGSVSDVRVLEGFYDQLDENARSALERWRFRPGTKNGVPVDVEAVIRVPFRVPSKMVF